MSITSLPLAALLQSNDPADFSARKKLSDVNVAVAKAKRAIIVSGAGISCSSGIPDFRSAEGLYALVKAKYPSSFVTGRDLFSSGLFTNPETTALFYTFIAELSLSCQSAQPTKTHHLIGRLASKGKLLRSYTQNIDGLERRIGLESGGRGKGLRKKDTKNVELHGDLGRVRCVLCMTDYEAKVEWVKMFREGQAPGCPACEERCASRTSRSARATSIGTLRPSIVLYDEPHPLGDDIGAIQTYDMTRSPDLLLIMGTSLKVHGLKRLVKDFAKAVHAKKGLVVFVNATPPSREWEGVIDVHIHGETDPWAEKVEEEWKRVRPQDWETQLVLDGEVVPVGPGTNKLKDKGKAAPKKVVREFVQLPTPRPSQSPSKSPSRSPTTLSADQLQSPPLTPSSLSNASSSASPVMAPPTPLSPSKRRANVAPSSRSNDLSPAKKARAVEPPRTGLTGTPGRGNLFVAPLGPTPPEWEDEPTLNAEIFGSPKKSKKASAKNSKPLTASGKENAPIQTVNVAKPRGKKTAAVVRKGGGLAIKSQV
ncbi:DHS-like NAD/FAD-binding domain-containing protein [Naematelia encephala]|uniref:DHS-like NAD/FAD-binding domain-containing protein n=1 Tax=Naematelia encephala TaxID=71784 RepID=A0A1Y2BHA5_9TREE|nr:DHS-like NAD/FAD-binding domain-containing protein [Naematelia encephala]